MSKKTVSVAGVEAILGYSFQDADIPWLALQAAGSGVGGTDGNKKLAMMGDSALNLILIDDLAAAGRSRGQIANAVQLIVSNNSLAERCTAAGLTQYINANPSQINGNAPKTRAATIQALIAAVYLDSGRDMGRVRQAMVALGLTAPGTTG